MARPVARPMARPMARPVARFSKFKPAQVPFTSNTNIRKVTPMAIVKPSGQVIRMQNKAIPVSKLTSTTNPNTVMNVSPVQRSYMPVDLPYQRATSKSKIVRIVNTPFAYAVNTDMVEPAVDSGTGNYYGK
jgi:hypothetical protein